MNLLDDSLSVDHATNGGVLNDIMIQRFVDLANYSKATGANAILFTCSAFGVAIEAAASAVGIPTLKPNQAMFDQALELIAQRPRSIGLLATFEPSLAPMRDEFSALAKSKDLPSAMTTVFVPQAMAALARGDDLLHHRLVAEKASQLPSLEIILLAQFSMAAALPAVKAAIEGIVLSSPDCAVLALQKEFNLP